MQRKFCIGIDPGVSGGLAVMLLGSLGEPDDVVVCAMPSRPGAKGKKDVCGLGVWEFLTGTIGNYDDSRVLMVAVESVHSMPDQGIASSFQFGKNYGKVLAVVETLKVPVTAPTPLQWQKLVLSGMGVATPSGKKRSKSSSIRYVVNNFPDLEIILPKCRTPHDGICEAVCLAEYARRLVLQPEGGAL
jgi:hypothetical protein